MGVDYTAALVYGAVIKMKRVPTTVTRYNEVTGEPYRKDTYDYEYVVGDTDVIFNRDALDDAVEDALNDIGALFLTDSTGYFGVRLASVDPNYGETVAIHEFRLAEARGHFIKMVEKHFGDTPLAKTLLANGELTLVGMAW